MLNGTETKLEKECGGYGVHEDFEERTPSRIEELYVRLRKRLDKILDKAVEIGVEELTETDLRIWEYFIMHRK